MKKWQIEAELKILGNNINSLFEKLDKMSKILNFLANNHKEDVEKNEKIFGSQFSYLYDGELKQAKLFERGSEVVQNTETYFIVKWGDKYFKVDKATAQFMEITELFTDEELFIDAANKKGGNK